MNPDKYEDHEPRKSKGDSDKRRQRRKSYKASQRQEKRLAEKLGGQRVSGSGAGKAETRPKPMGQARAGGFILGKGDVDTKALLAEAKSTSKKSLSLKLAWLEKIYQEADAVGKTPGLGISFEGRSALSGWSDFPKDWIMVPAEWLQAVLEKAGLADPA